MKDKIVETIKILDKILENEEIMQIVHGENHMDHPLGIAKSRLKEKLARILLDEFLKGKY